MSQKWCLRNQVIHFMLPPSQHETVVFTEAREANMENRVPASMFPLRITYHHISLTKESHPVTCNSQEARSLLLLQKQKMLVDTTNAYHHHQTCEQSKRIFKAGFFCISIKTVQSSTELSSQEAWITTNAMFTVISFTQDLF